VRHASDEEMRAWEETESEIRAPLDGQRKGKGQRLLLDLCPPVRGRWSRGQLYLPRPPSPAYGSFPTLRRGSPTDRVFSQWTPTKAP
jgi:hypothetical protein